MNLIPIAAIFASSLLSQAVAQPLQYAISFPDPAAHSARIEVTIPRGGEVTLFMPVWSPGYYHAEDYAAQVKEITAATVDGKSLEVLHPKANRWTVNAGTAASFKLSYLLHCDNGFVTTNIVGEKFGVLNGPATFISPVGTRFDSYDVSISLPSGWSQVATGLPRIDGPESNRFRAANFDQLMDCPIGVGGFDLKEVMVGRSAHQIASFGELGEWNPARPPTDIAKLAAENARMWGSLPFEHYVFLLNFRPGGGGLEHSNSTLITSSPNDMKSEGRYRGWLSLVSHEYFHAFNVKRLRPVGLGPFDYENPPQTPSLWISEGLTSYYGDLIVRRAGLATPEGYLKQLSASISHLQLTPGRLVQSLEQSSLDVWTNSTSGVRTDDKTTVSYYVKGPVAGFVLDAKIRAATENKKSLDDVMRLGMQRYSGERGFKPEEFIAIASEVSGTDIATWYKAAIASPGELDYTEALAWFGLRFAKDDKGQPTWDLEPLPDATAAQVSHRESWLNPGDSK